MQRYFKITFLMSEGKGIMHIVGVEIVAFICLFNYKTIFLRILMSDSGKFIY